MDFENLPTPSEGFVVTQCITVRSVARSRAFYCDVLGGQVVLEENPCIVKLANSWSNRILCVDPRAGHAQTVIPAASELSGRTWPSWLREVMLSFEKTLRR